MFLLLIRIFISFMLVFTGFSVYASESIKIAAIFAKTGMASKTDRPCINSAEFTVQEINRHGGLLGRALELIVIDSRSTPIGAKLAAKKAVELNVTAVFGGTWSSYSLPIARVLQKAKIPMITPISSNPDVTKTGDYIFRICFNDIFQGRVLADFAYDHLGVRTAVILKNINEEYSLTLSHVFNDSFTNKGGRVLWHGSYKNLSTDFSDILLKVKENTPDIIFIPGYQKNSGLLVKQAVKMGIDTIFIGGDGWENIEDYGGEYLDKAYYSTHWHSKVFSEKSMELKKIYQKKFGSDQEIKNPSFALTYDAIMLFADALLRAGSTNPGKIRDAIDQTVNFKGATGNITFNEQGDPIDKGLNIMTFKNGVPVFVKSVFPEKIKIASIFAHTGIAAKGNMHSIDGVRIGVNEINSRGGVLGRKFELIELDNKSTPIGSKLAAQEAVEKNVVAIIGCQWSSHSIGAGTVAQKNKVPMISNASTNESVTKIGDYIFRVCFTDTFQGYVMARFAAKDLNARTGVIFMDMMSHYSIGLGSEFKKNFKALGGNILLTLKYKLNKVEDFTSIVRKAKQANPDILFIPGHDESTMIIKEAKKMGLDAVSLGGDGWRIYDSDQKINNSYYCAHWSEDVKTEASQKFVKKYREQSQLLCQTALSYDAVVILADAIKRANSTDKAKVRNALAQTKKFKGVTGTISFNANRDPIKSAVIMEVVNGKARYLKMITP